MQSTRHLPTPEDDPGGRSQEHVPAERASAAPPPEVIPEAHRPRGPVVRAVGLCKRFHGTLVLNDVSLTLEPGEIFGLVGPNGAGKTTLMRILATLLNPDGGSAEVCGFSLANVQGVRQRIGFMPDFLGVYDDLLVREYLEFFARAHRLPDSVRAYKIVEVMSRIGISTWAEQPVDGLSRGMKQRLALARCLLHDPQLLLLDEPASGLDPLARLELREILRRLQRQGVTVLISSHVLEDLADICNRVGVMSQGRLALVRETSQLIADEGGKRLRVRAAGRQEELHSWLAQRQDVSGLRWDNESLVFRLTSASEAEVALLLADLVRSGFPVVSFSQEEASLESAYLNVTSAVAR